MNENLPIEPTPSSERQPITAEHVWAITGPSITYACQNELAQHIVAGTIEMHGVTDTNQLSARAQGKLQETLASTLPHEEAFVKSVSRAVLDVLAEEPDASEYAVLFDLDETTARRGFLTNRALHSVRPSAAPLMATLHGIDPRIKFGLLTSRSEEYLNRELSDPQELAPLVPYLDPTKVLSSREIDVENHPSAHLPPEKSLARDVRSKIIVCEKLADTAENTVILLIDDLHDFQHVQPGKNIKILPLDEDSQFRF